MPAPTLVLYLNRVIAWAILLPLVGFSMLALAIELREKAASLLDLGGGAALLRYALYTLPGTLETVAPIALLSGAVLGFGILARRGEAVILRAAGLSTLQIGAALLPLALLLGVGLHLMVDRLVPLSDTARQAAFRDLGSNDPEDRIVWLRAPTWIIRAEPMRADGTELSQVTIFKLGHDGSLEHRLDADAAHFRQNTWRLVDVIETSARTGQESRIATLDWHSSMAPYDMTRDETDRSVSMADAKAVLAGERMATEPRSFYEMRASRAVSIAAMPAVLILLAAPVVLGSGRSNAALVQAVVIAAALGLAFVMSEGLAASLGEKGLVEPQIAAWSPILIAMLLGFWAMLRAEG